VPIEDIDPVTGQVLSIGRSDKIVTAGSCFAQHIARYLTNSGYHHYVSEPHHPLVSDSVATEYNYGIFSARYGNIYTARQLLQLFKRAYGTFAPAEACWKTENDAYFLDPFRPRIQPDGFKSLDELSADRKQHLARVRQAFEQLDYFVFTLGLTEAWLSNTDGSVLPLCPGVSGGEFDDGKYAFKNFTVSEVTSDLAEFIALLRTVNPKARIVLTVSPVPLVATFEPQHVLQATTYSKSVLRVSCEEICRQLKDVYYFPSYEIITGSFSRGRYFADDLRSVREAGVAHVMRVFMKHYTVEGHRQDDTPVRVTQTSNHLREMEDLVDVVCDEESLDLPG
jgi:hypothetical protein